MKKQYITIYTISSDKEIELDVLDSDRQYDYLRSPSDEYNLRYDRLNSTLEIELVDYLRKPILGGYHPLITDIYDVGYHTLKDSNDITEYYEYRKLVDLALKAATWVDNHGRNTNNATADILRKCAYTIEKLLNERE